MTPLEFIKDGLTKLSLLFPLVNIRYEYNVSINSHVVQLTPEKEYYNNQDLDAEWIPFSLKFKETFKDQDIVFVSSDSNLSIPNPQYEWNSLHELLSFSYYTNLISSYSGLVTGVEFPVIIQEFPIVSHQMDLYSTQVTNTKIETETIVTFNESNPIVIDREILDNCQEFSLAA